MTFLTVLVLIVAYLIVAAIAFRIVVPILWKEEIGEPSPVAVGGFSLYVAIFWPPFLLALIGVGIFWLLGRAAKHLVERIVTE